VQEKNEQGPNQALTNSSDLHFYQLIVTIAKEDQCYPASNKKPIN
jgi:hypothetical protein